MLLCGSMSHTKEWVSKKFKSRTAGKNNIKIVECADKDISSVTAIKRKMLFKFGDSWRVYTHKCTHMYIRISLCACLYLSYQSFIFHLSAETSFASKSTFCGWGFGFWQVVIFSWQRTIEKTWTAALNEIEIRDSYS